MSPVPEGVPAKRFELEKIRKNSQIKLKDGRKMLVTGIYLGGDGPVLMMKMSPTQTVASNVALSDVDDFA